MTADELLFVPYSAWGHIAPMLAVAGELTAQGVPVRVMAGQRYRAAIESAGAVPVVPPVDHDVRVPAGKAPADLYARGLLWRSRRLATVSTAKTLAAQLRSGRIAACVVDPHVRATARIPARIGVTTIPFWTTYPTLGGRRRQGLANLHPLLWSPGSGRSSGITNVGPLMSELPSSAANPAAPDGRPLVVVSPGTVFERPAEFFRGVIAAFADSEWTVVLATVHLPVNALGPLPRNVVARRWVPQRDLVRRADVLLTHAGMSSVHEAITGGTPMLLVPRSREQRRTAQRLVELGIGTLLDRPDRVAVQAAALAADSSVRQRLRGISADASWASGPRRAAELLLDLSAPGRSVMSVSMAH